LILGFLILLFFQSEIVYQAISNPLIIFDFGISDFGFLLQSEIIHPTSAITEKFIPVTVFNSVEKQYLFTG